MVTLLKMIMANGGPITWKQVLYQELMCRLFYLGVSQQAPGLKWEDRQVCRRAPTLSPAWLHMPVIQHWEGRGWGMRVVGGNDGKGTASLKPVCTTEKVPGQPGIHTETLCLSILPLSRQPRFVSSEYWAQCYPCTLAWLHCSFTGNITKPYIILIKQAPSITNPLWI